MRRRSGRQGRSGPRVFAGGGKLSVQVLNEFTAVVAAQARRDWREIADAIDDALAVVDPPLPLTLDLHIAARTLAEEHRLSFYDALIVAAALEAGCDTLFTEDLQHGRTFGDITIVNPFLDSAAWLPPSGMAGGTDAAKAALNGLRRAQPNISLAWLASGLPFEHEADKAIDQNL